MVCGRFVILDKIVGLTNYIQLHETCQNSVNSEPLRNAELKNLQNSRSQGRKAVEKNHRIQGTKITHKIVRTKKSNSILKIRGSK
jgi:hypothetical protein